MAALLDIGRALPELTVQTPEGRPTTVQAHLGRQHTLLYFLHGTWCPECVGQFAASRHSIRPSGRNSVQFGEGIGSHAGPLTQSVLSRWQ
jgi:peroxiredoxin